MQIPKRFAAATLAVPTIMLLSGCGASDDSQRESSSGDTSPAAQAAGNGSSGNDDAAAGATNGYVPNHIILGTEGIQIDPSVQCDIFDEHTISIAGVGRNDDGVEFTFDVFDADSRALSLTTADGVQWSSVGTLSHTIETDTRVTGLTELAPQNGGDARPVSFAFSCK